MAFCSGLKFSSVDHKGSLTNPLQQRLKMFQTVTS